MEFVNGLFRTIKFELVVSKSKLNVLDLTIHLVDGFLLTEVYSKPSDSHLYLPWSSAHPKSCINAIPYGVALRLKRNCSTPDFLKVRNKEYQDYLINQGYDKARVSEDFFKASNLNRADLLKPKGRGKTRVVLFVTDYNPNLPNIRSNLAELHSSDLLRDMFPEVVNYPCLPKAQESKRITRAFPPEA